jgi:alanine racemase
MSRPTRAEIDTDALRRNFEVARRHCGAAKIWSVVKANAYGHGLLRVARALADHSDGFAVIEPESALALRDEGIELPILMMEGFYSSEELPLFAELRLTPVLHTLDQVDALERAGLPMRIPVYLKLNTGMNRLGLDAGELELALEHLEHTGAGGPITLMTHFADADEERGIADQLARFRQMRADRPLATCLANSAALLRFPESIGDWVRPGIMLYGASPFPTQQSAEALGLLPVMTLSSELIGVQSLQPGDRVGYAGTFVADSEMRVGVVACGYADGYPRHAPTGTPILVGGRRTRTLGRVAMDKICVDLTGIPDAAVGTAVTLWGKGMPADDVATAAGTVAYELFCALSPRVPIVET